jgi:hypothetical protein
MSLNLDLNLDIITSMFYGTEHQHDYIMPQITWYVSKCHSDSCQAMLNAVSSSLQKLEFYTHFQLSKTLQWNFTLKNDDEMCNIQYIKLLLFNFIMDILFIIFSGSAAQRGLWPPCPWGFLITHNTPQSVGLPWTSDQLVAKTSTW